MSIPGSLTPLFSTGSSAGAYQIQRSLRFNSADSAYLSRTPAVAGSRTTWTWAAWVKVSKQQEYPDQKGLFFAGSSTNNLFRIMFQGSNGQLRIDNDANGSNVTTLLTTQVFRDFSAWMHIVLAVDTTQATPSNRFKIYVNGTQVTTFSTATYQAQNTDTLINSTNAHSIGILTNHSPTYPFDGYLADIHFIDGQALTPSSFTEVSATTGQLIPKTYTGTYGTNGFQLKFADNSSNTASTLGKDTSGNSNNWTPNNFSVTQGTGSYTTNTTGTFAANRGAIKAFDGATSGSDFYAQPADGNTVTIGSLGITGITQLRMWLGKNNSGDPWGTLTLNATNVTSFLTTNYPSLTPTGQWIDLTSQLPGSTLSTITMTSPVANTDVRLSAVEVNGIVLIDRAASTTAGNDSLVDTPTSYGTDTYVGGEVRGNYCTLNPLDNSSGMTLANGNLDGSETGGGHKGTRATIKFPASGKWYYEGTVTTLGGACCIGAATNAAANPDINASGSYYILVNSSGNVQRYQSFASYTGFDTPAVGTILRVAYDADAQKLWLGLNGLWMNSSTGTTGDPATGANATFSSITDIYPAIDQQTSAVALNFGQRAFAHPVSGFKALCDTNLPSPLIAKGNTVMDVALWTANGSSQSITGLGFQPDLVWAKSRNTGVTPHLLVDSVRGVNQVLYSHSTDSEQNYSTIGGCISAFNSDGFATGGNSDIATNNRTFVGWAWDAGTSTVSNTAGSITSQVRANVSAGFSVVTYTGTGSNATVGHGLGVAPSMVIVKSRSFSQVWVVGHSSIGFGNYLLLNATDASAAGSNVFNSTAPTSTVFSLGTGTGGNQSAATYVAYCFAPVVGYSSALAWTGNGSADGPLLHCGFSPRFWIWKRTDTTGDWWMIDTARSNTGNPVDEWLAANRSDAEYPNDGDFDFLSNGIKIRTTSTTVNASGGSYIGFAWASNPFQYARAQ